MELRAEPYTLRLRPDIQDSEQPLRSHLNMNQCNGVLFNVLAFKNMANKVEYDAVLWKDDSILFIEYKNSLNMYKNLQAKNVQKKKGYARNVAKAFGFRTYDFIIVVHGLERGAEKEKGNALVISLEELSSYTPKGESTIEELDYIEKLLGKYERQENPVEFTRDLALKELKILRDLIEQGNR